jgi:TolA-binding protein
MKAIVLSLILLPACMVDRTGQSATSRLAREASIQTARVQEAEALVKRLGSRITEIEEVIVYRGEQEELELENIEGIQMEIRRLRNDVEKLQRAELQASSETESFRVDADARIGEVGERLNRIEQALGLVGASQAPLIGIEGDSQEEEEPATSGQEQAGEPLTGASSDEAEAPVESDEPPALNDPVVLAEQALADGRPRVAQAVLERALREDEAAHKNPELLYRYAESFFAEGLYEQAGLRYQSVVDLDASSSWAAWAMVRQGECFKHLGNGDGARFFWEDVVRQYPESEAARLAETLLGG